MHITVLCERFVFFRLIPIDVTQDLLVVLTIGVLSFSGGVALGVSGEEWREQIETWEHQGVTISSQGYRIPRNLNATGVSLCVLHRDSDCILL